MISGLGRCPEEENGKWQPALVFLPGKFHEQRGAWRAIVPESESDTTEHTHACNPAHHTPITLLLLLFFSLSCPGECMNNKGSSLYF